MKLYFVRHGQTDHNAGMLSKPSDDQPLNKLGVQQAEQLAEELKDVKFDAITSSPLRRAVQTTEIISKYHNLPVIVDEAWQEIKIGGYVDLDTWNDLFNFDKNGLIKNAESLESFFDRVYGALDELVAKYEDATVMVVSHGGVHQAVYAYANKLPHKGNMRLSPMKNCEYRIYELNT